MGNSIRIQLSCCQLCPGSVGVSSNQIPVQTEVGAKRSACLDGPSSSLGCDATMCRLSLTMMHCVKARSRVCKLPDREVYTRDTLVFPLADVAEKDLDRFSDDV